MAAKTPIEWTSRVNPDGTVTPGATWTPIRARVREDAGAIARSKGYASLVQIAEKMAGRVGPHCEKVSPACENCYSESNNLRCLPANGTGLPFDRRSRDLVESFLDPKILMEPMQWRTSRNIFVCSQTDLFAEWHSRDFILTVFAVMALCRHHTFLVLTKRPAAALALLADEATLCAIGDWLSDVWTGYYGPEVEKAAIGMCRRFGFKEPIGDDPRTGKPAHLWVPPPLEWPLPNVWIGVTAEDQQRADERLPLLLQIPAVGRFLSAEPLFGELDIRRYLRCPRGGPDLCGNFGFTCARCDPQRLSNEALDWVISGGESGRKSRPTHPDWLRSLRTQCRNGFCPFFFKQWGHFAPWQPDFPVRDVIHLASDGSYGESEASAGYVRRGGRVVCDSTTVPMVPVGKALAGRILDGREWNERPVCT